ncbi:MAG TPA: VCBS repeat-containing protein, partial [Phycisphaerae bacterium]
MGRCHSSTFHRAWTAATLLVLTALATPGAHAQPAFCLRDADGDRHPLFGNPEAMLNPIMAVNGAVDMTPTNGAIGDLDGDGDLDAVSTWAGRNPAVDPTTNISVLLNRGDGTFLDYAIYPCGDYPTSVAIGDLNGDGLNDLAVTNDFSGQVSVLMNAGGGTFPNRVTYTVGTQPRSCLIADFNEDGMLDLAVGNAQSNDVSILMNIGGGAFAPAVTYSALNIPDGTAYYSEPLAFGGPYMA